MFVKGMEEMELTQKRSVINDENLFSFKHYNYIYKGHIHDAFMTEKLQEFWMGSRCFFISKLYYLLLKMIINIEQGFWLGI